MKIHIEWLDQHNYWVHYTTMNHQPSALRTAENRARSTGKKHRLISDDGTLIDLISC